MKVLFIIPKNDPPSLNEEKQSYSPEFHNFVAACLTRDPLKRPSANELLRHPFITGNTQPTSVLTKLLTTSDGLVVDDTSEGDGAENGGELDTRENHAFETIFKPVLLDMASECDEDTQDLIFDVMQAIETLEAIGHHPNDSCILNVFLDKLSEYFKK